MPSTEMEDKAGGGGGGGDRGEKVEVAIEDARPERKLDVLYRVNDRPPWSLLFILALQQFMTMFGATFSYPLLMSPHLCMEQDTVGLSQLISTVIFVAGISTLLQTIFGVRLPIIQSSSYSFITPFVVLLNLPQWKCVPCVTVPDGGNLTCGSDAHADMWKARLREVQGAVMVSSLFQILVGFTGLVGFLLRFIGPLTITPTIAMIGLSLFDAASYKAQGQWWIAILTLGLMAIFSQYLRDVNVPVFGYRRGTGCFKSSIRFFALFPVLLSIAVAWLFCYILTATDVFPPDSTKWGYKARTDANGDAIGQAPWFRFPYPGQWGVPTVSAAGVLGSLAAVLASIVESVGDYYACARLSGAPPPPRSAVTRGIGMEGITCLLAGAWGSGGGTTSYSENIGAIGITKVGSRAVVQTSAVLMLIMACVGKFSAIFVTIPEPIVGGLFLAMFGMVTAVGISNLQHVDLNSSRNLFILGVSLFLGLSLPKWLSARENANVIDTGSAEVDNIFTVLCSTSMFVAGFVAFFLDNTVPGTQEERGLTTWRRDEDTDADSSLQHEVYDIPLIQPWLNRLRITKYLPFCPGFKGDHDDHKHMHKNDKNGYTSRPTSGGGNTTLASSGGQLNQAYDSASSTSNVSRPTDSQGRVNKGYETHL